VTEKLKKADPEAFCNIVGRMLEANGRRVWQPDAERLQELRVLYDVADEQLEGITP
jgi:magnesium chelatase subunit H